MDRPAHRRRRGEALRRSLCERAGDHLSQRERHIGREGGNERRRRVEMLDADLEGRIAIEGEATGQRLEEDDPDRVEIGRRAQFSAARLLGGHVLRRAEGVSGGGYLRAAQGARDAEVGQLDQPVLRADE